MVKNWNKYRLILFTLVIVVLFITRTFYKKDETTAITPFAVQLNRNIDKLIFTKHAKCRMDCRHITEQEIKEILHNGNINYNKTNLYDDRGPAYALEGYTGQQQHLRVVFAPKKDEMVVVTCVDLDKDWQCNCN